MDSGAGGVVGRAPGPRTDADAGCGGAGTTSLEGAGSVSGAPAALFPQLDFAVFPWKSVGLVSIPAGFLLGYLGARCSPERDDAKYAEMQVRALTGAGAAPAVHGATEPRG